MQAEHKGITYISTSLYNHIALTMGHNGFVNASLFCKMHRFNYDAWIHLKTTQHLYDDLVKHNKIKCIEYNLSDDEILSGVYIHEDLFARLTYDFDQNRSGCCCESGSTHDTSNIKNIIYMIFSALLIVFLALFSIIKLAEYDFSDDEILSGIYIHKDLFARLTHDAPHIKNIIYMIFSALFLIPFLVIKLTE